MDKVSFGEWLQLEREKRGWSQSDLARYSGLHRQIINKTENGVSTPAVETFIALANALQYSPMLLLRKAGMVPIETDPNELTDELKEQILHEVQDLPEADQQEILAFIRMKNNLRQQRKKK